MRPAIKVVALAALFCASEVAAQQTVRSARMIGMARSFTAAARGYEAIAANPALLGVRDRPSFSISLIQATASLRSNSYTLDDFLTHSGNELTEADKVDLLAKVREGGVDRPLNIQGLAGSSVALTVGNFGFSANLAGSFSGDIASDAVEVALFGNAGRKQPGERYDFDGTSGRAWAAATFALAYGRQVPVPTGDLAVGASVKLVRGLGVANLVDLGSSITNAPEFDALVGVQALGSDLDASIFNGTGLGLDVGGVYDLFSGVRFGLAIENLVSSMSWDEGNLRYYRQQFQLQIEGDEFTDSTLADIDEAFSAADPEQAMLRDSLLANANFPTRVRGGVSYSVGPVLLAGDLMVRVRKGLDFGDAQRLSGAVELRGIPVVRVRLGAATNFESGLGLAAGLGLQLGPVRIDAAALNAARGDRKGFDIAFGLSLMN